MPSPLAGIARFPRVRLGHAPTPLDPAPNLGAALGIDLRIKRDDCTGLAFGGNKVRQLEFHFGNARRMPVCDDEGGGVVHQRAAHHDARMDGGAIHRSIKESLVGNGPVAQIKEDRDEDLVAPPAKARFEVAPGQVRSGKRAVAAKPSLHPSCVQLEDGVHPRAVLGRQEENAQKVVRVVEELAQAARGDEHRGVDVDADESEELVVVEGGGSRALDAREERFGRWRGRAGRGIECGGLGADGGGKRDIGRHDGSILGSVGERLGGSPPPLDRAPADAPLDLSTGSRQAVASPGRIPGASLSRRG